jgi:hypothetical protein
MRRELVIIDRRANPTLFMGRVESCTRWVPEYPDARIFSGVREAEAARNKSGRRNAQIVEHYGYENEVAIGLRIYRDRNPNGEHFTVYNGDYWEGAFLADDLALKDFIAQIGGEQNILDGLDNR